ncbi:MAG: hypothetical protein E7059_00445 [Treponema bryantii]|nr:hypothetical protein [Treponema bryantii]
MSVKIKFDSNQDYQIRAVESVVKLFEGMDPQEIISDETAWWGQSDDKDKDTVPNMDELDEISTDLIQENYDTIRQENGLKVLPELAPENDGPTLLCTPQSSDYYSYPEFTINMETGTGKTYVYLRTIYSLYKEYGWRKFVVVVPSVAIREGAIATFKATREHFETLFGPIIPQKLLAYDSSEEVTLFKTFGISTNIEILLMTRDSFDETRNKIYKPTEKIRGGKLPIAFVQETRPILILDEVQNYQTDTAKKALRTLHPMFSIGYSATPGIDCPNELYRLSSYEASQLNLVKKIDILGFQEEQIATSKADYFKILSINKTPLSVEVELNALSGGKTVITQYTIKATEKEKKTFQVLTKNPAYKDLGIEEISVKDNNPHVRLTNGMIYLQDEASCANLTREIIFRQMIKATIEEHIKAMANLKSHLYDAKVLSLFFIDRVASYKGDNPIIARIFDEEFEKAKDRVLAWKNLSGKDVREGYFARKVAKKSKLEEDVDTPIDGTKTAEDKEAEKKAYNLIMREKEKLLSNEEPVCFIFAHSALREGWDNPNVFQICALREITSESSRRQTIGRGLRLPVNQNGERIKDSKVNRLTVIANESYSRFVGKLQEEYIEDGVMKAPQFTNKRHMETVHRTVKFQSDEFEDIWRRANRKTEYTINIKTDELIAEAIEKLNQTEFDPPKIVCSRGHVVITIYDLKLLGVTEDEVATFEILHRDSEVRNLFGELGVRVNLKKGDVLEKLAGDALNNCPELGAMKVTEVHYDSINPSNSSITFSKLEHPLKVGEVFTHNTTAGQSTTSSTIDELDYPDVPKCNIVEMAAKEINLTKKTVLAIFKGLKAEKISDFMKNPNGFTGQFISVLKEVVANHIACNIEYEKADGPINKDVDSLFPLQEEYPITELVDAKEDRTIYEKIQVDSDVERHFVDTLNNSEQQTGGVVLYFKFPPKYKINLPHIIGNYNPDWAIVRRNENSKQIELVRETKGTDDLSNLWHSNEARKIICAQKHFKAVGLDYRFIDGNKPNTQKLKWWDEDSTNYRDVLFGKDRTSYDDLFKDTLNEHGE